jgi:hypothetical protein
MFRHISMKWNQKCYVNKGPNFWAILAGKFGKELATVLEGAQVWHF